MTINLEKSLDIEAPISDVFAVWADAESALSLLPHAQGSHLELTEHAGGERLSWRLTGPDVTSTATVQLEQVGEGGAHTKMTLTAHYPNGIGPQGDLAHVTASMDAGLGNVARLLRGEEALMMDQGPDPESQVYSEVTASAASFQHSLVEATDAWAASLNKTFQVASALAWLPFQGALLPSLKQGLGQPRQSS